MTLELEIDVPESRTITLPPEVPVGKAMVSVSVPSPAGALPPSLAHTSAKFQRERAAYYRLLPELLKTHLGKVVAIHDGQVVEAGTSRIEVAMATFRRVGAVPIFVELVTEDPPRVFRIPGLRLARREEVK